MSRSENQDQNFPLRQFAELNISVNKDQKSLLREYLNSESCRALLNLDTDAPNDTLDHPGLNAHLGYGGCTNYPLAAIKKNLNCLMDICQNYTGNSLDEPYASLTMPLSEEFWEGVWQQFLREIGSDTDLMKDGYEPLMDLGKILLEARRDCIAQHDFHIPEELQVKPKGRFNVCGAC